MANQQCSRPYKEILISKLICAPASGFTVDKFALNPKLREDQRCIVALACKRGKSALFLDTETGKTFMQLEWARLVAWFTGKPVLILTPITAMRNSTNSFVAAGDSAKRGKFSRMWCARKPRGLYLQRFNVSSEITRG